MTACSTSACPGQALLAVGGPRGWPVGIGHRGWQTPDSYVARAEGMEEGCQRPSIARLAVGTWNRAEAPTQFREQREQLNGREGYDLL